MMCPWGGNEAAISRCVMWIDSLRCADWQCCTTAIIYPLRRPARFYFLSEAGMPRPPTVTHGDEEEPEHLTAICILDV